MYSIALDGRPLFDPRLDGYALQSPKLHQSANKFATLSFTIFPDHPEFGQIKKLSSILTVYRDGEKLLDCRPTYSRRTMRGGVEYKCEECLAWLNDFKVRPFERDFTISGLIDYLLAAYNNRVPAAQRIKRGRVTVSGNGTFSSSAYDGYWDTLQKLLVSAYGGYIIGRYESDGLYLDYLREENLPASGQKIVFGENLASLFVETDADETYSVIVPIGADVTTTGEDGEQRTTQTDITTVNGGLDYLESAEGIALYGRREIYMRWDKIENPQELLNTAREWLRENAVKFTETVRLSAVDLHNADVDVPALSVLTRVDAESELHDLAETYVLSDITIPLGAPDRSAVQLGGARRTLTDKLVSDTGAAKQEAGSVQTALLALSDAVNTNINTVAQNADSQAWLLYTLFGADENCIFQLVPAEEEGQKSKIILNSAWQMRGDIS